MVTRARGKSPSKRVLSPVWGIWVAENLLRGASPEQLVAALQLHDVPLREARRQVKAIHESAALLLARSERARAERSELVCRLVKTVTQRDAIARRGTLTPQEFFTHYYATNTPVILTQTIARWTPEELRERFRDVPVQMTTGRESDPDYDQNRERHYAMTTMGAFVDRVLSVEQSNDFYLIARNYNVNRPELQKLFDDIDWSHGYLDAARARSGSALWFGPAGTVTPLHHDTSNILFAQVHGRKKFVLAAPTEVQLAHGAQAMYAGFDPENPDYVKRPDLRNVQFYEVVLEPGELLFIPVGWWHHVRALSVSISLALNHFVRPNQFGWYLPGNNRTENP